MIALAKPMLGIEEKTLVNEIPVHPGLKEQEVDYIVSSLQKYE